MRSIARRLHRHRPALQPGRQLPLRNEGIEHVIEMRGKAGVKGHVLGFQCRGKGGDVAEVKEDLKHGENRSSRMRLLPLLELQCPASVGRPD